MSSALCTYNLDDGFSMAANIRRNIREHLLHRHFRDLYEWEPTHLRTWAPRGKSIVLTKRRDTRRRSLEIVMMEVLDKPMTKSKL